MEAMDGNGSHCLTCSNLRSRAVKSDPPLPNGTPESTPTSNMSKKQPAKSQFGDAFILSWSWRDVLGVAKHHPIPSVFGAALLFFMGVEYTLYMIPPYSPPFDLGFVLTRPIHRILSTGHALNTVLAGLNTVCNQKSDSQSLI